MGAGLRYRHSKALGLAGETGSTTSRSRETMQRPRFFSQRIERLLPVA